MRYLFSAMLALVLAGCGADYVYVSAAQFEFGVSACATNDGVAWVRSEPYEFGHNTVVRCNNSAMFRGFIGS